MIINNKQRIFSGVQPTGNLHIGNYIGAISQWLKIQEQGRTENFFCIVDLHAITVFQNPKELREKILETACLYLACGLEPKKSIIFIQSENPAHTYLTWILDCFVPLGWLKRMTQFKEKSQKQKQDVSVGLFNYPVLMAADILLYQTDYAPVGKDQKQHLELAKDTAQRFNSLFKEEIFKIPEALIEKKSSKIMSLSKPCLKMSKSDKDFYGTIDLLDKKDDIRQKIKRAVTDSGAEIYYAPKDKPGISNFLVIYSKITGLSIKDLEKKYQNVSYSVFKNDLTEAIISFLTPIQKRYSEFQKDKNYVAKILSAGNKKAEKISCQTLNKVKQVIGLGRNIDYE